MKKEVQLCDICRNDMAGYYCGSCVRYMCRSCGTGNLSSDETCSRCSAIYKLRKYDGITMNFRN